MSERTTMNGKPVFTVSVKTVLNLHSGFEKKLLCDGPTFSTGDACAYKCAFCYVPSIVQKLDRVRLLLEAQGLRHEDVVIRREHSCAVLRKQLVNPGGKPRFMDPADRRVVYSSPLVDVAANMELVRETVDACKLILAHTHWQIRLLSKSNLLHKVAELLCEEVCNDIPWPVTTAEIKERMIFGVSTGTLDDSVAAAFEEDTPKVSKRLASLHWLQDHGFRTFGMICPSLPLASLEAYDKFARDAADAIRADQCEHVWAEVINLRGESMSRTCTALANAGHMPAASLLEHVATNSEAWEHYNRGTFLAHVNAYCRAPGKLRYLTYTNKATDAWWRERAILGAVVL